MFTLVTWNVNSLRARLEQVLRYLDLHEPDVVCLQEIRVAGAAFPAEPFVRRGYQVAAVGHGSYAGVALLSRRRIDEEVVGLPGFYEPNDPGRRLACRFGDLWIDTIYTPTRRQIGKIEFLTALREDHDRRLGAGQELILAGDLNICFDARDYASPTLISEAALHPDRAEDRAFRALLGDRLRDCFRRRCEEGGHYSWYPYARWAVPRNYGMRLDYVFATAGLVERVVEVVHDLEPRRWERPSDHAPVRASFAI